MPSIEAVTVPRWGMTMTEGTITQWLAAEGDVIERGQEIAWAHTTQRQTIRPAAIEGLQQLSPRLGDDKARGLREHHLQSRPDQMRSLIAGTRAVPLGAPATGRPMRRGAVGVVRLGGCVAGETVGHPGPHVLRRAMFSA